MALTVTLTNKFKEVLINGEIKFGTLGTNQGTPDTYKMILMNSSYTFNEDTHEMYSQISANQLANGYGYVTGGSIINPLTVSRNDTTNKIVVTYPTVSWTATGGDIGFSNGAIIYNDTHANKVVVLYINFGTPQIAYQGGVFSLSNGTIELL